MAKQSTPSVLEMSKYYESGRMLCPWQSMCC